MTFGEMLLRAMRTRKNFFSYYANLSKDAVPEFTWLTIELFKEYFHEHESVEEIGEEFMPWCESAHKFAGGSKWSKLDTFNNVKNSMKPLPDEIEQKLHDRIIAENAAVRVKALLEAYTKGESIDLYPALRSEIDVIEALSSRVKKDTLVSDSIDDILADEESEYGLKWRLTALNRSMRPLRPGDFGIIAARPDAGKSSFIAAEITNFARQLDEGCPVLWLNNEGPGRRIKSRCYQAAIGATISELSVLSMEGRLGYEYAQATGGAGQILIRDIHDMFSHEIEDLIKNDKPGVVVFDMLDNVKYGGAQLHGGTRTDQILETMYQWGRNLAVKYDCAVLATSQISGEGEGQRFPLMTMLKDSKTGKQGAADFILMIGRENGIPDARYISLPKNKLHKEGGAKDPQAEVAFDGQRSRFGEPKKNDDGSV